MSLLSLQSSSPNSINYDLSGDTERLESGFGRLRIRPTPYDVDSEEEPTHLFFSTPLQKALEQGKQLAQQAAEAIENSNLHLSDETLRRHWEQAKLLSEFQPVGSKAVAVLGDSGAGKSSLINALLNIPRIARAADSGRAVTSVVTEFHHKQPHHAGFINVEVEHMSLSERKEALRELLRSYRRFYMPQSQTSEDAESSTSYRLESRQAWGALEAAFKHHPEFNEAMIQDISVAGMARADRLLDRWTSDMQWPASSQDGIWRMTAASVREYHKQTKPFTTDRFWPFTKVIRVYVEAYVLRGGTVLVDLPGLRDTNLARVKVAEDYLLRCSNVFIVAKIGRAIENPSVSSGVYSTLQRHAPMAWEEDGARSLNLAIVCTKSEEMDLHEARAEFCGPGKPVDEEVADPLLESLEEAEADGDERTKNELEKRLTNMFMEARNAVVKEGLRMHYANRAPGANLDVFCVASRRYHEAAKAGDEEGVRATEIPELRRFCRSISADAQLRDARNFLRTSLPELLASIGLWATRRQTMSEAGEALAQSTTNLRAAVNILNEDATESISRLRANVKERFVQEIKELAENQSTEWSNSAFEEAQSWVGWAANQYAAWCKKNGSHTTHTLGFVDWNPKFIWKMRAATPGGWLAVENEVLAVFAQSGNEVERIFTSLAQIVADNLRVQLSTSLLVVLGQRQAQFSHKMQLAKEDYATVVRQTRQLASESNASSYLLKNMDPTYERASREIGTGMRARQQAIMHRRLGDPQLFKDIVESASVNIDLELKRVEDRLQVEFKDTLELVRNDIEFVLDESGGSSNNEPTVNIAEIQAIMGALRTIEIEGHRLVDL